MIDMIRKLVDGLIDWMWWLVVRLIDIAKGFWDALLNRIDVPEFFDYGFMSDLSLLGPYITTADQVLPLTESLQAGGVYLLFKLTLLTIRLVYRGLDLIVP